MVSTSLIIYFMLVFLFITFIYKILNSYWVPLYPDNLKEIPFFYYGHRGAPTIAPENTLLSFEKAIESNMNGIELDIQITKDNKLIIYHDKYIEYNESKIKINNLLLKQIQEIDVSNNFHHLSFQKVPELLEVLKMFPNDIILNIEIKSYQSNFFSDGIEDELFNIINEKINLQQLVISSFNPFIVKRIKKMNKKLSTALIWSRKSYGWLSIFLIPTYKIFSTYCKPDIFHVNIDDVNNKIVDWFQKRDIPLYAYTVNTKSDLDKAKAYNLNGIFTDDPNIKNV